MAAQLNYSYSTPKAVPGQKADITVVEVVNTRINEEDSGVLKFGMALAVGTTAGDTVKKPVSGTTAAQIEGVLLHAENTEQDQDGTVIVKKGSPLSVMKKGHVWARIAEDVTPVYGAPAYVIVSGDEAGFFTATSGNNTVDIGAKFGKYTEDGIAVVLL